MDTSFAGWITRPSAAALSRLVDRAGFQVREEPERVWLRIDSPGAAETRALARIAFAERFELAPDGTLVREGGRVPRGRLAQEGWTPLADWIRTALPAERLAPRPDGASALRLVRGGSPRAAQAIVLAWERFAAWADTAAQARLSPLRFARAGDGRALVLGLPHPPLPGTLFVREDLLLIPCGFRLDPPVDAACAARALGLADGELALFRDAERFEVVPTTAFVGATRGAVRTTTAEAAR